jgi:hypothetical protein
MKREHSTKKIGLGCSSVSDANSPHSGQLRSINMPFPIAATTAANTASNGAIRSRNAVPHRKNAAQRTRSDSPYQQRTTQRDNPTQLLIKQAVDYLIQQLEAGKSETLTAYLNAMARFHSYSFGNILQIARQRAVT